jgi:hypothetical protein
MHKLKILKFSNTKFQFLVSDFDPGSYRDYFLEFTQGYFGVIIAIFMEYSHK